jgi:ribosomal protein S18 acetylase RimI-like enzyme
MTDTGWIGKFLVKHWDGDFVVSRGRKTEAHELEGAVARKDGRIAGLVTWRCEDDEMEITSLDSLESGAGIGTALLEHAVAHARTSGLRRAWLTTTNDNVEALRFYQKRGMRLCALHPNAVEVSRKIKPEIPETGNHGIPIRDEIELEMVLA